MSGLKIHSLDKTDRFTYSIENCLLVLNSKEQSTFFYPIGFRICRFELHWFIWQEDQIVPFPSLKPFKHNPFALGVKLITFNKPDQTAAPLPTFISLHSLSNLHSRQTSRGSSKCYYLDTELFCFSSLSCYIGGDGDTSHTQSTDFSSCLKLHYVAHHSSA
jgi:hypothetical protein